MVPPLLSDLKKDTRLIRNLNRILLFVLLFFLIDFAVSALLLKGAERFYGLGSDANILMLGHSHLMLAVDKVILEEETGKEVAKYTREGVNMADRRVMAAQYFNTAAEKPETVILSIDPWLFTGGGLSQNSWRLFLPFMDNREVDKYISASTGKRFDYIRYKVIRTSRFDVGLLNAAARGWLKNWDNLKFGTVDTVRYGSIETLRNFRPITFNRELMDDFAGTLDFLDGQGARVLLLNAPVWEPMIKANQPGYDRSMFLIDSIVRIHCPDAEIIDLVPAFSAKTEFFFDPIHMNPAGQKAVTVVLGRYLVPDTE